MFTPPAASTDIAPTLAHVTVRSAMQLGLFHCEPDDPASVVAQLMARQSIHAVVVAGIGRRDHAGERLTWGIVSDLDLMRALPAGLEQPAGEVAGSEIVTVSPRESLAVAAQLMTQNETAHLVVVSPDTGRPVGMLSTLDIACAIDAR
jgi:CBS domain-containing protein